jgi:hypothetical protein
MKKKPFLITVVIVFVLSLAAYGSAPRYFNEVFTFIEPSSLFKNIFTTQNELASGAARPDRGRKHSPEIERRSNNENQVVPDEILYFILFNHLVGLQEQSEKARTMGKSFDHLKVFREEANLDVSQSVFLFQNAQDCLDALKPIDDRARQIIQDARTKFPTGEISSPENLPPPPSELKQLQEEKNAVVVRYRNAIKSYLGDLKFLELEQFVKQKISPNVERNALNIVTKEDRIQKEEK